MTGLNLPQEANEPTNGWRNQPRSVKIHKSVLKTPSFSKVILDRRQSMIFLKVSIVIILTQKALNTGITKLFFNVRPLVHIMNKLESNQRLFSQVFRQIDRFFNGTKIDFVYILCSKRFKELLLPSIILYLQVRLQQFQLVLLLFGVFFQLLLAQVDHDKVILTLFDGRYMFKTGEF